MTGIQQKDAGTPYNANWESILGLFVVIGVGSVANSAGVGGGVIFVPLLQALVGFALKDATALSQALITAGAFVSVCINLFKRSPVQLSAPLIDFYLALALVPVVLAGVCIGVLLNQMFPPWLITILLILLTAVLIFQAMYKGITMWRIETLTKLLCQPASDHHQDGTATAAELCSVLSGTSPAPPPALANALSRAATLSRAVSGAHRSTDSQMFIGNITSTAADSLRASLHRVATLGRHRTLGHNISGVHRSSGSAATLGFTLSSPFALGYDSNSGRFRGQASSGKRTGSSPQTHLHTSPHAPAGMSPARGSSARAYSLPRAGSLPAHATRLSNSAAPAILAARASASADQQPGDLLAGRADSFVALAAFHPDMAEMLIPTVALGRTASRRRQHQYNRSMGGGSPDNMSAYSRAGAARRGLAGQSIDENSSGEGEGGDDHDSELPNGHSGRLAPMMTWEPVGLGYEHLDRRVGTEASAAMGAASNPLVGAGSGLGAQVLTEEALATGRVPLGASPTAPGTTAVDTVGNSGNVPLSAPGSGRGWGPPEWPGSSVAGDSQSQLETHTVGGSSGGGVPSNRWLHNTHPQQQPPRPQGSASPGKASSAAHARAAPATVTATAGAGAAKHAEDPTAAGGTTGSAVMATATPVYTTQGTQPPPSLHQPSAAGRASLEMSKVERLASKSSVDVALSTSSSNFNNSTSGNHGISSASGNQQDDTAASCPLSPVLSSGATQQQRRFGQWRSLGGSRRNNSQKSRFLPRATTLDTSRSPDTEIGVRGGSDPEVGYDVVPPLDAAAIAAAAAAELAATHPHHHRQHTPRGPTWRDLLAMHGVQEVGSVPSIIAGPVARARAKQMREQLEAAAFLLHSRSIRRENAMMAVARSGHSLTLPLPPACDSGGSQPQGEGNSNLKSSNQLAVTKEASMGAQIQKDPSQQHQHQEQDHLQHQDRPDQRQGQLDIPGTGWSAFLRHSLDPPSDHEQPEDGAGQLGGHSSGGLSGKLFGRISRGRQEGVPSPRAGGGLFVRRSAGRPPQGSGGGGAPRGGVFGRSIREPCLETGGLAEHTSPGPFPERFSRTSAGSCGSEAAAAAADLLASTTCFAGRSGGADVTCPDDQAPVHQQAATEPTQPASSGTSRQADMHPAGNSDEFNTTDFLPTSDVAQQDQAVAHSTGTFHLLTIQALPPAGDTGDMGPPSFMPTGIPAASNGAANTQATGAWCLAGQGALANQPSSLEQITFHGSNQLSAMASAALTPASIVCPAPSGQGAAGKPGTLSPKVPINAPASLKGQHQLQILNKLRMPARPALSALAAANDTTGQRGHLRSASSRKARKQGISASAAQVLITIGDESDRRHKRGSALHLLSAIAPRAASYTSPHEVPTKTAHLHHPQGSSPPAMTASRRYRPFISLGKGGPPLTSPKSSLGNPDLWGAGLAGSSGNVPQSTGRPAGAGDDIEAPLLLTGEEEEHLREEIESQIHQPPEELHLMRQHNKSLLRLLPDLNLPRWSRWHLFKAVLAEMGDDLRRVPKQAAGLLVLTWLLFAGLQVARSVPSVPKCSRTWDALFAVQMCIMISISTSQLLMAGSHTGTEDRSAVAMSAMSAPDAQGDASEMDCQNKHQSLKCDPASATHHSSSEQQTSPSPPPQLRHATSINVQSPRAASGRSALGSTPRKQAVVLLVAMLAGLTGGLLGLGGGTVMAPLLLQIGVQPQVASATSSLMVLFSSSAALVSYGVLGRINLDYALAFGSVNAFASLLGVLVVGDLVRRSGRTSIIVFCLAAVMIAGLASITGFGIPSMIRDFQQGDASLSSACA